MLAVLVVLSWMLELGAWAISGWILAALVSYYYAVYLAESELYLHYTDLADGPDATTSAMKQRSGPRNTPLREPMLNSQGYSSYVTVKDHKIVSTRSGQRQQCSSPPAERHLMNDPIHAQWVRKPTVYSNMPEQRKSEEVVAGQLVAGFWNGVFGWKEMLLVSKRSCEPIIEDPMTYNMVKFQIVDENPTEWTIRGPKETAEGLQRVVFNTHPETTNQYAFEDWILWGRHYRGNKRFGAQAVLYHRKTCQKDEQYHQHRPSESPTPSDDIIASIKQALTRGRPTKQDIANMPTKPWPAPFTWKPKAGPCTYRRRNRKFNSDRLFLVLIDGLF